MGGTDLDAFLREVGVTRERLVRVTRAKALDLAQTIHDEIRRYWRSLAARPQGGSEEPVSRGPDEFTEDIEKLLAELRTELGILVFARDVTREQITIDGIEPDDVTPCLAIAARAQRGARDADSPTPRSSTRAALDIALNRVDRYVKGIAALLGEPIVDLPAEERESQ